MALQGIQPVGERPKGKSALDNAYKAFNLATTLGSLYGQADTVFGSKLPSTALYSKGYSPAQYGLETSPLDWFSKMYGKK